MNKIIILVLILLSDLAFAVDVHIDVGSYKNTTILDLKGNSIKVIESYLRAVVPVSDDKERYFDVLIVYDPKTHLFWWEHYPLMKSQTDAPIGDIFNSKKMLIYTTGTKIIGFLYSTSTIWFIESSKHCSSLSEGQSDIILAFKQGVNEIINGKPLVNLQQIEVGRVLMSTFGPDFFSLPNNMKSSGPKLINVKKGKKDKNWHMIFEGTNRVKGEVVISETYKVLGAALLSNKR